MQGSHLLSECLVTLLSGTDVPAFINLLLLSLLVISVFFLLLLLQLDPLIECSLRVTGLLTADIISVNA